MACCEKRKLYPRKYFMAQLLSFTRSFINKALRTIKGLDFALAVLSKTTSFHSLELMCKGWLTLYNRYSTC